MVRCGPGCLQGWLRMREAFKLDSIEPDGVSEGLMEFAVIIDKQDPAGIVGRVLHKMTS